MAADRASTKRAKADPSARLMGNGLSALRIIASAPIIERFGLRPMLTKAIFEGAKRGYGAVTSITAKQSASTETPAKKMVKPSVPSLFDLKPTDEQVMMVETVRRFSTDYLREHA